jgi:hypothetical protein
MWRKVYLEFLAVYFLKKIFQPTQIHQKSPVLCAVSPITSRHLWGTIAPIGVIAKDDTSTFGFYKITSWQQQQQQKIIMVVVRSWKCSLLFFRVHCVLSRVRAHVSAGQSCLLIVINVLGPILWSIGPNTSQNRPILFWIVHKLPV